MNRTGFDPTSAMRLWTDAMRMGFEAQYVMGMRMAGMMGFLPHHWGENMRMVTEKGDAARESFGAVLQAASRGDRADQMMSAAMKPYGRRTRANARRLSRSK